MDVVRLERNENGEPYIQLGENILRFETEDIDEIYEEKARQELGETPENVEAGLVKLRALIEGEPGLNVPLDYEFLIRYLRPCKFYPDTAFKFMRNFYRCKLKHPKYFTNLVPPAVAKVYSDGTLCFLPKRCRSGARIMVINIGSKWNPKEVPILLLTKAILVAVEIAMGEPKTQVSGVHIIIDMEGVSMSHIWQMTPSYAKLVLFVIQECLALRLLEYSIVNQSVISNILYNIFKPFIGEKLRKKIFFHGTNWPSLHKLIDADCLPRCWGGTLNSPDCPGDLLNEVLQYYGGRYEKLNTYGYSKKENVADG